MKKPRKTVVVCLVFAFIALTFLGCSKRPNNSDVFDPNEHLGISSQITEEKLTEWDERKEYSEKPKLVKLVEGIDISGTWSSPFGFTHTSITFTKNEDDYSVEFYSSGCLSRWKLPRTAKYIGNTIQLNKPVREYSSSPYSKLYTIKYKDKLYLVASERVKNFEEDVKNNNDIYEMWLLKRVE